MVAKRPLLSPAFQLQRISFSRGIIGGHRGWRAVAIVVWGVRILRSIFGKHEEVVLSEVIQPGQTVAITSIPTFTRQQRKQVRKALRRAKHSSR